MLGYNYYRNQVLIGSKNASTLARTAVTVTSAFADNLSRIISTGGSSKIELLLSYTAKENGNNIDVRVEWGFDGTNMYQLVNDSTSGATSTLTQRVFTFDAASSATAYELAIPLDASDKFVRIAIRESAVGVNYGTAFVELLVTAAK